MENEKVVFKLNEPHQGFTIIELVIVLFIAGALVTIIIPPFFKQTPDKKLFIFSRQVASDLKLAQQMAIANNWKFALKINDDLSYKIVKCSSRMGNCGKEKEVIKNFPPKSCYPSDLICNISDFLELDKGTYPKCFEFNPDGWSSGGKIRIKIKAIYSSHINGREIIVSPIRGRLRIERYFE